MMTVLEIEASMDVPSGKETDMGTIYVCVLKYLYDL